MIRKADIDDIPSIRGMASIVFPETYKSIISSEQIEFMMDMMYSEESITRQMNEDKVIYYLIEDQGYVSFSREGRTDDGRELYHLDKLYVLPAFQGQGLGRELFEKVLSEVRSISGGDSRIELNVNRKNPAVSFYERMGMTKARSGDFPIGKGFYMNDYIMAIDL